MWHPTEDVLVSVSYDDTVKVWTEDPGGDWSCTVTVGAKEGGHESTVWSAAFEAGMGRRMVTCSDDRTLGVWEAKGASTRTRRRARGDFFLRTRLSSSSSSRYAPLDVRRLHRGGGAGQTVESDALQMRPGQHKLPARSNRGPGSPSRQNCNCGITYLWTLQICVDNIRAEPSTPRRARSPPSSIPAPAPFHLRLSPLTLRLSRASSSPRRFAEHDGIASVSFPVRARSTHHLGGVGRVRSRRRRRGR